MCREEGNALIPARLIADMVKSLAPDAVELEADASQAKVVCRSFEGTIRCLAAEDFPAVRDVEGIKVAGRCPGLRGRGRPGRPGRIA